MLPSHNSVRRIRPERAAPGYATRLSVWRRRAATLIAGVLVVVMAYGVIFGHNGITAYAGKRRESEVLVRQMQQLQLENSRLQGHVERLQSDPSAIEHQAREELHYTRSGEVIYTLPDSDLVPTKVSSQP